MVILQVLFDYKGGFGDEMYKECKDLAYSINQEKGFLWNFWTQDKEDKKAGGIYAFDNEENAKSYILMHKKRLSDFGVASNFTYEILNTNDELSKITNFKIK